MNSIVEISDTTRVVRNKVIKLSMDYTSIECLSTYLIKKESISLRCKTIEEQKKFSIIYDILQGDDSDIIAHFIDNNLKLICDYVQFMITVVISNCESIKELLERSIEPDNYDNEGIYLDSCDMCKNLYEIVDKIMTLNEHWYEECVSVWNKVTIDDNKYIQLILKSTK